MNQIPCGEQKTLQGKVITQLYYKKGDPSDERTAGGIIETNYFANFRDFMKKRQPGATFFIFGMEPRNLTGAMKKIPGSVIIKILLQLMFRDFFLMILK